MNFSDQRAKLNRIEARVAAAMDQGSPITFAPRECITLMGLVRLGYQTICTWEAMSCAGLRELAHDAMSEETKAGLRDLDAREHAIKNPPRGFNG
jgi:hypothetical protein